MTDGSGSLELLAGLICFDDGWVHAFARQWVYRAWRRRFNREVGVDRPGVTGCSR